MLSRAQILVGFSWGGGGGGGYGKPEIGFEYFSIKGLLLVLHSSSSAFPAISLGLTIFGEIFAYVTFFNPAIQVVTFHLHGCSSAFNLVWLSRILSASAVTNRAIPSKFGVEGYSSGPGFLTPLLQMGGVCRICVGVDSSKPLSNEGP